jgi:hypothetical protein
MNGQSGTSVSKIHVRIAIVVFPVNPNSKDFTGE